MGRVKDLKGQRFGRLVVIEMAREFRESFLKELKEQGEDYGDFHGLPRVVVEVSQEKDHWTEAQMLTESEYYDNLYTESVPDLKDKPLQDIQEKYNGN